MGYPRSADCDQRVGSVQLGGVRLGEKVQVVRADGSASTYTIGKITVVSKTDFPSQAVFARTQHAHAGQ